MLHCGSIGVGNVTYSLIPEQAYGSMTKLTTTKATIDATVPKTTSTTPSTNTTYWKISVPESTQGICQGSIQFTAVSG